MAEDDQQNPPSGGQNETPPPATGDDGLGDKGKQALDRMKAERDEARRQAKSLADVQKRLQEYEDRDKTDAQRLEERATRAEQALNPLQSEALRLQFAVRKASELDPAQVKPFLGLVDRLRGSTDEELSADADALLALLGNTMPPPTNAPPRAPSFDGGARGSGTPPAASVASGAALYQSRHGKPT